MMCDVFKTAITALVSIVVLFIFCRLAGQREIGQLSLFDYINSITIGSAAADLAMNFEQWWKPLTATVVYGIVTLIINYLNCKSPLVKKLINGKPIVLIENNTIYKSNFLKAKLNINEFIAQARISGYFDITDLKAALLETNGKISFLPFEEKRSLCRSDMNIRSKPNPESINIILDGQIQYTKLEQMRKSEKWLLTQLSNQGIGDYHSVFLATYNPKSGLTIFKNS